MIRSALKNLWNRRGQNLWIFIELVLVTIIAWVVLDKAVISMSYRTLPLGYDADRLAILKFNTLVKDAPNYSEEAADSAGKVAAYNAIEEKIRNLDGVEIFTHPGWMAINDQGLSMTNDIHNSHSDSAAMKATIVSLPYKLNDNFFETHGIEVMEGSPHPDAAEVRENVPDAEGEKRKRYSEIVMTKDLARHVFSDMEDLRNAIGYEWVDSNDWSINTYKVAAIVDNVRYGRHMPSNSMIFTPYHKADIPYDDYRVAVRLRPGYSPDRFVTEVLANRADFNVGNYYLESAKTQMEQIESAEQTYGIISSRNLAVLLAIFFLVNLILGVTGTFTIQARKRMVEMGIRRSFGATRGSIITLMVAEGLILTTLAFIIGDALFLQYALKEGLASGVNANIGIPADFWVWKFWPHFLVVSLLIYLLLATCTIIGILFPATRVANVNPVDALRDE